MKRRGRSLRKRLATAVLSLAAFGAIVAVAGATGAFTIKSSQGTCVIGNTWEFECNLGNLSSGGNATIEVTLIPEREGMLKNTATVSGNEYEANDKNNMAMEMTTVLGVTDLAITKSDAPDPVLVDKPLTYTLTVTNNGPSVATGVVVTDYLPNTVTLVSASSTKGSCSGSGPGVTCQIGAMLPNTSASITIVVIPHQAGEIYNKAVVNANEHDPKKDNNKAHEKTNVRKPSIDLGITKTDNPDPVYVGQPLTYTITVTNSGPDNATGVVVKDKLIHQKSD